MSDGGTVPAVSTFPASIEVDVWIEDDSLSFERRVLGMLRHLHKQNEEIMADLTALNTAVADNTTATQAVVAAVESGSTDQAGVDAAVSGIQANTDALNSAVASQNPAPPPPAA